jgi:hypothetical protein
MPSLNSNSHPRWRAALPLAAIVPSILAVCFSLSGAQNTDDKSWETKDWTQWTKDDCSRVFEAPWGQWTFSGGDPSPNGPYGTTGFGHSAQLRSALPVRQALLRTLQLDNNYDKMKHDKKQLFDRAHAHDLDPIDQVKVYIANVSMEPPPLNPVATDRIFGPQPARQAALGLANGTLVLPLQIYPVKYANTVINEFTNQYEYTFPRAVAGKPLYSVNDSFLIVELGAPLVLDKKTHLPKSPNFVPSGKRYIFKISDLMYKGNLEY